MSNKFLKYFWTILFVLTAILIIVFFVTYAFMRDQGLLSVLISRIESILIDKKEFVSLDILILIVGLTSLALLTSLYIYIYYKKNKDEENDDSDYYNYLKSKIAQKESEKFDENRVCDNVERDCEEIISKDEVSSQPVSYKKGNTDIYAHMMRNLEETTEYFIISKSQVKQSHMISLIACTAGVSLLFIAILMLLSTQRVDLAVIPAASGAITEVVSGTVLWIYNKSSSQLNHYYDALHENERFLSIVNLVGNLSPDKQDVIYMEIIRSQLDSLAHKKVNVSADTQSPQNPRHSGTSSLQE